MIIKTLLLPQITHLLSAIFIPDQFLKEVDRLFFSFLWNNKPARIKRDTITASISDGGLKMIDIFTFHTAQKSMWIKKLLSNTNAKWSHLFETMCGISKILLDFKLPNNCLEKYQNSKFHYQVLQCWFQVKSRPPETVNEILNEYICLNRYITVGGECVHPELLGYKDNCINFKIFNLLNNNNEIGTVDEIYTILQCNTNFLSINSILQAIPKEWKQKINANKQPFKGLTPFHIIINKIPKLISDIRGNNIYWELMNGKAKPPTEQYTWLDLFPFLEKLDWKSVYTSIYKITNEPYLLTFQYKVINRSLNCNYNLCKWKIRQNNKCSYCTQNNEIDTLEHHLYYCHVSRRFWKDVSEWLGELTNVTIKFAICDIVFGMVETYNFRDIVHITNLLVLLGKWYLNKQKTSEKEILFSDFVQFIHEKVKVIRMTYVINGNLSDFMNMYGFFYN